MVCETSMVYQCHIYTLSLEASLVVRYINSSSNKNTADLPALMKKLDGSYYQTFGKALTTLLNLEESYATTLTTSCQATHQSVQKINRDKENEQFVKEFQPVFIAEPKEFKFESSFNDSGSSVCVDDVTKVVLGQRLSKIISRENEVKQEL